MYNGGEREGFSMLTNFDELKSLASSEMNKSFPAEEKKCGVTLTAKSGKIYKGHRVAFSDGQILDPVDMALYAALADGETKFLAAAICGNEPPSKAALRRLASFSDMMVSLNIGAVSADTSLRKLLLQLGDK